MSIINLVIECVDGKSRLTPEEISITPGDTLSFQLASGPNSPGSYAIVAIPDERLVDENNQFKRIKQGETIQIQTKPDAPSDSFSLIIYTEECGLLVPPDDGFESTTKGPPIIIT